MARWLRYAGVAAVALGCLAGAWWYFYGFGGPPEPERAFDGDSASLRQTVVVPTLDTPLPQGKSAVWCASGQLAWNRLKEDLAKGPVQVENAQTVADRLNRAVFSEADLQPDSYFAAAGWVKDGIVERIQATMAEKFPDAPQPHFEASPDGTVAYGYLRARVGFSQPFFESREALSFTDSAGSTTPVRSFGIRKKDRDGNHALREQVDLLFCSAEQVRGGGFKVDTFILDPCKHSQPNQLVLARIGWKPTLAEMLADLEDKVRHSLPNGVFNVRMFASGDTLLVPAMNWRVVHEYRDLEGKDKRLQNPALRGQYISRVVQMVDFKLTRGGAELRSEFISDSKSLSRPFHLDQPFLVLMRKRGAEHPFFVMWVDNAELLSRW
jgi:hypothetical protein